MTALIKYEAARSALAEARSIDEVKDIRDKAEAMRAYGRMAKDRGLEIDAAEIRIMSERRLGQMLRTARESGHLHIGGRPKKVATSKFQGVLLREIGIDKGLSSRAQRLASSPDNMFDKLLAGWRERVMRNSKKRVTVGLDEGPHRSAARAAVGHNICGGDIRHWTVAKLRRVAGALARIAKHCGAADDAASIGDCVSDAKLVELCRGEKP